MESFLNFITKKEVYGLVVIIVLVLIINNIFNIIVDKIVAKSKSELERKRKKTVIELVKNIKKYAILTIGILFVLDLYGINITTLVASLGVASALLALALQDSLKDIISGAAIIMDNYYIVGDYVEYNGFFGTVIQLGLRSTKIQGADGRIYIIANRNISEIVNVSQKQSAPLLSIPTAYEEPIEKVEKVLNEVVEEMRTWPTMDKEKTSYLGILELSDSSIQYGIRFYCKPSNQWKYKWDALRLIKQKYDKNNIKIPYNQVEVHNGK